MFRNTEGASIDVPSSSVLLSFVWKFLLQTLLRASVVWPCSSGAQHPIWRRGCFFSLPSVIFCLNSKGLGKKINNLGSWFFFFFFNLVVFRQCWGYILLDRCSDETGLKKRFAISVPYSPVSNLYYQKLTESQFCFLPCEGSGRGKDMFPCW